MKLKLTLEALAERVGSSKSYMWELENKDVTRPSAEKLQQIANALETTVEYLLGTSDTSPETAADRAFFRRYQRMGETSKKKLRDMLKILDGEN
jgi:transcriptional regulator with XRE-family HTH domain